MKMAPTYLFALALFGCMALSVSTVVAEEPFPQELCVVEDGTSPKALGVTLAYGIVLGERMQDDIMSQAEFMEAMTSLQGVTQLMLVDQDPAAACALIAQLEETYDLPRPDLDALPYDTH